MDTTIEAYLEDADKRYSAKLALTGVNWSGPGYHSQLPPGEWVHPTRDSLEYALVLLIANTDIERATSIIQRILSLQDQNPTNRTYGIWSWLYEEPLDKMAPPDWNWADFLGAMLCHILIEHRDKLTDDLVTDVTTALGHAAWSIFRRNVRPDYTNIAIMGAVVTGIAGEILNEPRLSEYARIRMGSVLSFIQENGGLTEYNSPTYTPVALFEVERALQLANDPQLKADAEALRRIIWETIATHYHVPTAQWAGPHSRAYSDYINPFVAQEISRRTGVTIPLHTRASGARLNFTPVAPLPCPPDLIPHFEHPPQSDQFLATTFTRAHTTHGRTYREVTGYTWLGEDATLGSVNYDSMWTQRRTLLGYWRTNDDPAVVLRIRFLRDGRDFASAGMRNVQDGPRVLSLVSFMSEMGDYHLHLDQPEDGVFHTQDLRLRYELVGRGVEVIQIDNTTFALQAGQRRAKLATTSATFNGKPVEWRAGTGEDHAFVDAILYNGPSLALKLQNHADFKIATGLSLDNVVAAKPIMTHEDDRAFVQWAGMTLEGPGGLWPRVYFSLRE